MVALKTAEVEAFMAKPHPARPIVLVFGPDAGLVSERVEKLIQASVDDPRDPFALVHLSGDLLASEPSRLAEAGLLIPDENDEEAAGAVREDEVEKFKEFLDSVSPDDFKAT